MDKLMPQIAQHKIVPVIKINHLAEALPLAEALLQGGLPVAEITFRTQPAAQAIRQITQAHPQMIVGAGTIINVEQAKTAVQSGAQFLVTPGFSPSVADYCAQHSIPLFPGACTPTELMELLRYNLPVAKFFPAGQFGGLATIQALAGPFPQLKFMPTGGVNASNICDYLACDKVVACGGSWMVPDTLLRQGQFQEITQLVAQAVALVQDS